MPKHSVSLILRLSLSMAIFCLTQTVFAQTAITTITEVSPAATATQTTHSVTAPSDADNGTGDVQANEAYDISYGSDGVGGTGTDRMIESYTISGHVFENFLRPDTLVVRRTDGSNFINIWYSIAAIDNDAVPNNTIDLFPSAVTNADAIYQSGIMNGGYDNILVNNDDIAGNSIQAQVERVDIIWYSGIRTSQIDSAVYPIMERGGNDNIKVAAIKTLDANGDPASYFSNLVSITYTDAGSPGSWTGGSISIGQQLILRRQIIGEDPIPILVNASQSIEGIAITFNELGITANEVSYGFSIFASDVDAMDDLVDFASFPNGTLSSVSGLDLVAGLAAAVSSDLELIENVGPGGYKSALSTWLKANEGITTATEASTVTLWEDQAIGNHDADDSFGSTSAPVYRSTSSMINFNPTVDFTNTAASLDINNNDDFNTGGPFTNKGINIAFRTDADGTPDDVTTRQVIYEQGGNTRGINIYIRGGSLYATSWNRNNDGAGSPWNDSGSVTAISETVTVNTEYIITLEEDGDNTGTGTLTIYLNGRNIGSLPNVGLLYEHTGGIEMGASDGNTRYDDGSNLGVNSFSGEISEFIYCNEPTDFATATRNKIESYLAIKYGITLDQTSPYDYVNSAGTTIFNTTNAASVGGYLEYNNDIAGVGRDDDSELIQLQSRSENSGSIVTIGKTPGFAQDDTWLIWGNDAVSTAETDLLTMPDTIDMRIGRVWRVAEEDNAGAVTVTFDLAELGLTTKTAGELSLLIASNSSNADFSSATIVTGGVVDGGANTITFSGVSFADGEYFTLGTDFMLCSPGGVELDLKIWLKANAGTSTTVNAADVTTWNDQSITGSNATGLIGDYPRYISDNHNYNPGIDFNLSGEHLRIPNNADFDTEQQTIFVVGTMSVTSDDFATFISKTEDENITDGWLIGRSFDGVEQVYHKDNFAAGTRPVNDLVYDVPSIHEAFTDATDYNYALDGATPSSTTRTTAALNTTQDVIIGAAIQSQGPETLFGYLDGTISEVILYNRALTAPERLRVSSYLAIKYGLTLDQTSAQDYVNSASATIWDGTTNSGYNDDIAGIGRDDLQCFEQKQSSSENSDGIVAMGLGTIAATNAANANSFANDNSFLLWGDDNAAINFAGRTTGVTGVGSVTERMTRIWKVDETVNDVGATSISFDLTGLGYGTTLSDYQLVVSDAAGLTSPTLYPASSIISNVVTFTNINLADGQFFTLGTARDACGPGAVSANLALWLRADAGTSSIVNGADIETWSDQANSNDATGIIGDRPSYVSNAVNFNPAIDFDESNFEEFRGTAGFHSTAYYIVANPDNSFNNASTTDVLIGFDVPAGATDNFGGLGLGTMTGAFTDEVITHAIGGTGTRWRSGISETQFGTVASGETYLIGVRDNVGATGSDMYVNGLDQDDLTSGTFLTSSDVDYEIGSYNSTNTFSSTNHYDGQITEVISYSVRPTDAEHNRIQSYLSIKYGITLNNSGGGTAGDYVRGDGTTIWDASDYSAHHNDVAGIGRDDDGCFIQKQSSSVNTDDILTIGLGSIEATNADNVNGFDDDGDYLLWGNDNGTVAQATANTADLPSSVAERMSRVWRVDDTGAVGATEIQFDLTGLGYSSSAEAFRLIISDSPTMASGSLTAGGTFNGSLLSFSGIDLTDGQYFTLATALETCGPGGVNTGLSLWLRADLDVFEVVSPGTDAAEDGDNVLQWKDQGPGAAIGALGTDLGGGTPVEPTFETSEINFNPVLRFIDPNSNNSSYIETGAFSEPTDDFTLVSVFKSGQDQGTLNDFVNTPALIGGSETGSDLDYGMGLYQGQVIVNASSGVIFDASTTGTSYNNSSPHIALATRQRSSGDVQIFMEGQTDGTGSAAADIGLSGASTMAIGNHSDGDVQAQFGGDIAESIIFSKVLSGEEQSRVESYLALKYGLTISADRDGDLSTNELIEANDGGSEDDVNEGDYVAGDGDIVWDYADQGATYYNDIFGIARDDLSCFDQPQSKSINSDAMVTFNNTDGFSANDSWLISGNDNAPVEAIENKERPASIASRLNREWRVQETGTVGQIELTYDLTSITGTPTGDNNLNLVRLMVDDDGDFSNGGTTLIEPTSIDGGAKTVTFLVDFTDGQYYTLGSTEVNALPITLISFDTRTTSDNKVEVIWATAQEVNNSFYTIERSRDGLTFETIAFVEGAGNSDQILDYSYIDEEPLDGISYYRLKQTDFNGDFDHSEVSRVRIDLPESSVHKVVPNPVNRGSNFKITYPVTVEQDVRISIANANGVTTYNKIVTVRPEDREIEINTDRLATGLYFIRLVDQNLRNITIKFIVR